MTIKVEKAMGILQTEQKCLEFKGATDRRDAIKLGIEALKRHALLAMIQRGLGVGEPLPGETKE